MHYKLYLLFITLAFVFKTDTFAQSSPISLRDSIKVNDSSSFAIFPKATVDYTNKIHVVWVDGRSNPNGGIYYSVSENNGLSFNNNISLSADYPGGYSLQPVIQSNMDNMIVAFERYEQNTSSEGKIVLKISRDLGKTFNLKKEISISGMTAVSNGPDGYMNVNLAYRSNIIFLTWQAKNIIDGKNYIYFARYNIQTDTVEIKKAIQEGGRLPSIILDNNGFILIAYAYQGGIYLIRSTDSGNNFNSPTMITSDGSFPFIALNKNTNNVYLSWSRFGGVTPTNVFLARSADGGNTFLTEVNATRDRFTSNLGAVEPPYPIVLNQATQKVYVLWRDTENSGVYSLEYDNSLNNESSITQISPENIKSSGFGLYLASLNTNDMAYLYSFYLNNNYNIYYRATNYSPLPPTVTPTPSCILGSIGDIDCSGVIDISDFKYIVSKYGLNEVKADLNKSTKVNFVDAAILLMNFGRK